jgi:hypothetical protein
MNSDFREIPGFPGYVVDKIGCVYGPKHTAMAHQINPKTGYLSLGTGSRKERKRLYIHRAVALAWIPNPNNYSTVDHINRNKQDNRLENLRWADRRTQSLNKGHKPGILGEKYIYNYRQKYLIQIGIYNKLYKSELYSTLAEAVEERDQLLIAMEVAELLL